MPICKFTGTAGTNLSACYMILCLALQGKEYTVPGEFMFLEYY